VSQPARRARTASAHVWPRHVAWGARLGGLPSHRRRYPRARVPAGRRPVVAQARRDRPRAWSP